MTTTIKLWAVWRAGRATAWTLDRPGEPVHPDAESDTFLLPDGFELAEDNTGMLQIFAVSGGGCCEVVLDPNDSGGRPLIAGTTVRGIPLRRAG